MPHFNIANQQHQQNPVNELSCTNLCTLVSFLRKKYMRLIGLLFMVHGV